MRFNEERGSPLLDYNPRAGITWMISFKAIEEKSNRVDNLLLLWAFLDNKELCHDLLQAAACSREL